MPFPFETSDNAMRPAVLDARSAAIFIVAVDGCTIDATPAASRRRPRGPIDG